MLLLLPNYTEVQLVIYLEAATRFCAAETPKRQTSSPWSQVIHLRVIKSMQAVFIMRKMEKCKGNTTSHKHPPGHSDTYQTPIYRDTLFPSAQNTLRTAYFLTKCGVLKQEGFRDIRKYLWESCTISMYKSTSWTQIPHLPHMSMEGNNGN